jgi:retinol dehydrogenase-12
MTNQSMHGRSVLITGATNGIGKESAVALAGMGADVIITARDERKGRATQSEVKERTGADIDVLFGDLASLADVRRLAGEYRAKRDQLHVLLNNAGAYNPSRAESKDGYELTIAVNHLAHFLLTDLLLDLLKANAPARVINVSSDAHSGSTIEFDDLNAERGYSGMRAYGQSKLANILFTRELARRLEGTGVTANSVHPGVVRTGFGRNSGGFTGALFAVFHVVGRPFTLDASQGAETQIYLASSPEVEDISGEYFVKRQVTQSSAQARDDDLARRLWDVSEELVKAG